MACINPCPKEEEEEEEGEGQEDQCLLSAVAGKSCCLPVAASCLELQGQKLDDSSQHCPLDVQPLLIEEASFQVGEKCTFQNLRAQEASISVLSEEADASPNCSSQLALLSFIGLPFPLKSQKCLDSQFDCQGLVDLQIDSLDSFSPCVLDIDIEMEKFAKPKSDDGSRKSEGLLTGVLQRQGSLKTCGKMMHNLTDHGSSLLKLISRDRSFTERGHDTTNNRCRKYKRTASFDGRKVVLLFSVLSSLGTLVLIYLTLKVRQAAEGLVNI